MSLRHTFGGIISLNKNTLPASRSRRSRRTAGSVSKIEALESRLFFSVYTVTSLGDNGSAGTLRWAVNQVNADSSPDTINFASGLTGTISLGNGQLELSGADTTITGPGSENLTIDGGSSTTLFRVDLGVTAAISGLTLANGFAGAGGAVNNSGSMSIADCVFNNNSAPGVGGAIFSAGSLSVADSTFSGNSSGYGGAIYVNSSSADISGCTSSGNSTTGNGGAVDDNFGTVTVENSTFAGNTTDGDGGAIFETDGVLTVTNATLSTNTAAMDGGGLFVDAGSGDATIYNTIVAGNFLSDGVTANDLSGSLDQNLADAQTASSNNLIGLGGSGGLSNGSNGNIVGASAGLSPLADNGGPTQTMALLGTSKALNAGSNALALDAMGNPLMNDQRGAGFSRILHGTVDIGAFESTLVPVVPTGPEMSTTITVANVTAASGGKATLSATLLSATDAPIAGQKVVFMVNGVKVGSAKTNAAGVATLKIHLKTVLPGDYATGISASFAGDATDPAASGTGALMVSDAPIHACDLDVGLCNGQAVALLAFSQHRPGAMASDYTVTIDWGDGSGAAAATVMADRWDKDAFNVEAKHTYAASKTKMIYTVTTTITSKYGATLTLTRMVTVKATVPVSSGHGK